MENKMKKGKKILLIFIAIIAILYFIGILIFSKFTYPLTYLNDENIGFKPLETVFTLDKEDNIYIYGKNDEEYILNPTELQFDMRYEKDIEVVQNSYLWPVEILNVNKIQNQLIKAINGENLTNWINNSDFIKYLQKPEDAKIIREDGKFVVVEEIIGDKLEIENIYKEIEESYINSYNELILEYEEIQPNVFKKDLLERTDYLNELLKINISIILPDDTKEKLNIDEFIHDNKNEIDKEKIIAFVNNIKNKYDNANKSREFINFNGEKVIVKGGNYGILINLNKTVESILKEINKSNIENNGIVELVYTSNATNGGQIGKTYVEISISDQRMVFYKDGNIIVDTPIVTGLPNGYYNTPRGVWNVWIKETSRYLQGKNLDGSEYKSWVNYWMQVDYTGVGIHDASWQSSFGGQRYKWAGSHGCINTPYNAVQTIYNNIDLGTPVIIY